MFVESYQPVFSPHRLDRATPAASQTTYIVAPQVLSVGGHIAPPEVAPPEPGDPKIQKTADPQEDHASEKSCPN